MIITSRKEVFYKIEMTAQETYDLQLLLETRGDGHCNELSISAAYGSEVALRVHTTLAELLTTLETR